MPTSRIVSPRLKVRARRPSRRRCSLHLEQLESRELLTGTWTPLVNQLPSASSGSGTMLLQTDGTVMVQGGGVSNLWFKLTPDSTGSYLNGTWSQLASMNTQRLYCGSVVLPSGKVIFMGGEYSGPSGTQNETNTGEMYNPLSNVWSPMPNYPQSGFGDDPLVVLANGNVLAGYNGGSPTYLYNPSTNAWSFAADKLNGDTASEECWVKLPDGSILSYAISASISSGLSQAQRYIPSSNTWVSAGTVPVPLSSSALGYELGPAGLLPDGRVFQVGANNLTALYTPSTNSWAAGPTLPSGMGADDAPGAVTRNGHFIFAADTSSPNLFTAPAKLFDYDPVANTITQVSVPAGLSSALSGTASFPLRMLVVPSGDVLLTTSGNQIWDYNPNAAPQTSWEPTVSSVTFNGGLTYTLTGTQLNGISEGASYGDDAQMASNYPIVELKSGNNVYFARTFNWVNQVATGSTQVTTQFSVPSNLPLGAYSLTVIANGIASAPFAFSTGLAVASSTPANGGSVTSPPSAYSITFSSPITPSSLLATDLTVQGVHATGVTLDASNTVATFTFASNPVTTQGPIVMSMPAGVVSEQANPSQTNAAYSATFSYDVLPLAITGTTPAAGGTFTLPGSSFTYDVAFNEPIDPSLVNTNNLVLSTGTVSAAAVQPGNQLVAYTLTGLSSEGTLSVNINSGTFKDQYDNLASPSLTGSYYLDDGTLPVSLTSTLPAGSLIYSSSAGSVLLYGGDTDSYTVAADPGQTLTVLVIPSTTLAPLVQINDPSGKPLGITTALAGENALLETIPTTTSGAYTISVGGQDSTTGTYTVQVTLNAALENEGANNALSSAQDLDGGFISLGGTASRAAALGQIPAGQSGATIFSKQTFETGAGGFTINNNTIGSGNMAGLWHLSTRRGTETGHSDSHSFYYGSESTGTYDTGARNAGTITSPVISLPNEADELAFNYVLQTEGNDGFDVAEVEVSTNGFSTSTTLLTSATSGGSNSLALVSSWTQATASLAAFAGQNVQIRFSFDTGDNLFNDYEGWYVDDVAILTPIPPVDYYSFSLAAGDTASLGVKSLSGGSLSLALENSAGTTLASGSSGAGNVDKLIANFVAPTAGLYTAAITGSTGTSYSLTITHDAALDAKTNSSFASAQDITGNNAVLGDAAAMTPDWYKLTLGSSQTSLLLQTSTPLGGPSQPLNPLAPSLQLFDASDNLIGSGSLLPDGRNQSLLATGLTSGATYYIELASANSQPGEYVIDVITGVELTTPTLPNWTVNVPGYNQTISALSGTGATGPLTFTQTGTLPPGLTLASNGLLSGTPTTTGAYSFTVTATDSLGFTGSLTYTVVINLPFGIATTTLPNSIAGNPYLLTLATTGGTSPVTFTDSGALPPGLTLTTNGVLSGTPAAAGSYSFTVTAIDATGDAVSQSYTLSIFVITPATLPNWTANLRGYSQTFSATGGTGPYTFSTVGLPGGLTMSTGGVLAGTPTTVGPFSLTVTVTDSNSVSVSQNYALTINPIVSIATRSVTNWTQADPGYSQTIVGVGGTGPLTYSVTTGTLPRGLALGSNGVLSGTPDDPGIYGFTVTATDTLGATGGQFYTVVINATVSLSPASLPQDTQSVGYNQVILTSGGTGSVALTVTNITGVIPGLSVPASGSNSLHITGLPTAPGTEKFTIATTDSIGATVTFSYSITVNPLVVIFDTSLPDGTISTPYTKTISSVGGTGALTFSTTGGTLPTGLSLSSTGVLSGTPSAAGSFNFTVTATDTLGMSASRTYTVVINPAVTITTTSLASWTINKSGYGQTIAVTGGTGAKTFALLGGLPTGLSLSAAGAITGKPATSGAYTFTVVASDTVGAMASQTFTITINPAVVVTTTALVNWTLNQPGYGQSISATGGTGALTFASSGSLPGGLTLSAGGVLAGTPSATGTFNFTVTVTDGVAATGSQSFTVTINPAPTLAPGSLLADTINIGYHQTITGSGGTGSLMLTVSNLANVIAGLNLPGSGTGSLPLTGTPTATGTETFTVTVTDSLGAMASQSYAVVVNPAVALTTMALANWTLNRAGYSQTLTATGGTGALTFSAPTASLPPGLTLSSAGVLAGTPTAAGTYTIPVTATDSVGGSAGRSYALTVNPVVTLTTTALAAWTVNFAGYSQTLSASGGTGSLTFAATGTLPTGLTLSSAGVLSGTPSAAGSYSFAVTATDSVGAGASTNYTVTINPGITLSPGVLPGGLTNQVYNKTISASGGTGTIMLSVTSITGAIPGLSVPASGTGSLNVTGTPTATGTERFTLTATDSLGASTSTNYAITITPATVFLNLPSSGYAASPGGTVLSFPININELQDQQSTNHVGLASATIALTFPTGVFNFPTGTGHANGDVSLGSVPLSDTVSPGGAADWTLTASSLADGQLNITLTAKAGKNITSNSPAAGGSLVLVNFPVLPGYNPATPTAQNITVVNANGSFHTAIIGNNGNYTLTPTPPYAGSITINPAIMITTSTLADWTLYEGGYNQTIQASGGGGPLTFSTSGVLPAGLTLSSSGVLSGTPTTLFDNLPFPVTVTDSLGHSATQDFSVTIHAPTLSVTTVGAGTVQAGSGFLVSVQAFDWQGNPITNDNDPTTLNASISPTAASNLPTTISLNSAGMALFLANVQKSGAYTINVVGGVDASSSPPLTVTPGPAVKLAFVNQPANTPTGVTLPPVTVAVLDQFGNLVATDSSDTVSLGIAGGPGAFMADSSTTAPVQDGIATFNHLTLVTPGSYTLSAQVPTKYTGPFSGSFVVAPLQVLPGSLLGTPSGFSLQFNAPYLVNSVTPVLYGAGLGANGVAPSVIVTTDPGNVADTAAYVEGSLVLDPADSRLSFVATNTTLETNNGTPLLADGTYTVIVRSNASGFAALNAGGGFLDGLDSGLPGSGDFTTSFVVNAAAQGQDVVWVPDVAEGPGQALNAPGMNQAGGGYPLYLTDGDGVTGVQVTLTYDPRLLQVSGVTGPGFSLSPSSTPGQAVLIYSGSALASTPGTPVTLGYLTAQVPAGTAADPTPYRAKDLLTLTDITLSGGGHTPDPSTSALHLVAYVGDADGDGTYTGDDAALITRTALQTDSGFAAYPLVDPVIVADTDGNGFIPADAALQVNEAGVNFPTITVTSPPSGTDFQVIGDNVDPSVTIPGDLAIGADGTLVLPVNLDDPHPQGSTGLTEANLALAYDPRQFTVSAADVHLGSLLAGGGWSLNPTINPVTGQIAIALSSSTPIQSAAGGSLVTIDFHQLLGEPGALATGAAATPVAYAPGSPGIALVASVNPTGSQVIRTELEDAQGTFTLTPAPGNGFNPQPAEPIPSLSPAVLLNQTNPASSAAEAVSTTARLDLNTPEAEPAAVPGEVHSSAETSRAPAQEAFASRPETIDFSLPTFVQEISMAQSTAPADNLDRLVWSDLGNSTIDPRTIDPAQAWLFQRDFSEMPQAPLERAILDQCFARPADDLEASFDLE